MKKLTLSLLPFLIASTPLMARCSGGESESISELPQMTDNIYRPGNSAQDGAYTALSLSMLGWGVGLAAGIGVLAAVLHQSTASHSDTTK